MTNIISKPFPLILWTFYVSLNLTCMQLITDLNDFTNLVFCKVKML
jgi:hypothetical protein